MIVKCIKEDRHEHLRLNRTHFVYGIQYINEEMHYCILPYEGIWYWSQFGAEYFQIIDETIPTNWKFGMHRGFFGCFTASYEEAATDEDHYGGLVDSDPIEKKIFQKKS